MLSIVLLEMHNVLLEMHNDKILMKVVSVTAQKNIWKGGRQDNLAWEEIAAGSFSGVECVAECQERIATQILRKENDLKNIKSLTSVLVLH